MHELSIALSILEIAAEESDNRGGAAIKTIYLRMGPLCGVVRRALESAFELARENSPMASSDLVIEDVPLVVFCSVCDEEQTLMEFLDLCCPVCGTPCPTVVRGRELEVTAMEIEG